MREAPSPQTLDGSARLAAPILDEPPFWSLPMLAVQDVELASEEWDIAHDGLVAAQVLPDTAIAPPAPGPLHPQTVQVDRAFGFADLCGFSRFTSERGPAAAFAELSSFREVVRAVAAARGVRIARWLGDGVFLVGVGVGPVVATLAEVLLRHGEHTRVRGAVAAGPALLFEGDDYLGDAPNRASRLSTLADPDQLLLSPEVVDHAPDWLVVTPVGPVELRGIGLLDGVCEARALTDLHLPPF